jgi:hypothetical protein
MLKTTTFWDTEPCSLVEEDRRFGGEYCLIYHGDVGGSKRDVSEVSTASLIRAIMRLMMGTALTFETSVYFNETRGRYIPRSPL